MRCSRTATTLIEILSAFVLGSLASGCSRTSSASINPPAMAPAWNWEKYPAMPLMRLANLPCQLLPKSSITIHSPMVGVLRVYVDRPQTNLPAGFIWAEFEPAIFAAEAQAIEEARIKLEEREKLQLELELPRQKLKFEKEMDEAQRQLALLNLLSTNTELAKTTIPFRSSSGSPIRPEALSKAQLEVNLLEQSLQYLRSTNLAILGIDLPGQRSEWRRRQLEFERRQFQARLKMPFTGQLTVNLPLTEGVEEYPVNLGQELAVARDMSLVRLRVPLANASWVSLPTDRLFAVVRVPNGEAIRAEFSFQKIERVQLREESVYYFQVPLERAETASRLLGADMTCELWLSLPQAARIVPKLSLVLNQPGAFQGRDWADGVRVAWPGAQVLVEGQTDLAIIIPTLAKR